MKKCHKHPGEVVKFDDELKGRIMEVDINQQCTVKLLKRGVEAIEEYYANLGIEQPREYEVGDVKSVPARRAI